MMLPILAMTVITLICSKSILATKPKAAPKATVSKATGAPKRPYTRKSPAVTVSVQD